MTKTYFKLESITAVQSAYRVQFNKKQAPSRSVILNMVSVFEKTGSVAPMPPKRKETSQKRESAKNQLKSMFDKNPKLSIRKAALRQLVFHQY